MKMILDSNKIQSQQILKNSIMSWVLTRKQTSTRSRRHTRKHVSKEIIVILTREEIQKRYACLLEKVEKFKWLFLLSVVYYSSDRFEFLMLLFLKIIP